MKPYNIEAEIVNDRLGTKHFVIRGPTGVVNAGFHRSKLDRQCSALNEAYALGMAVKLGRSKPKNSGETS